MWRLSIAIMILLAACTPAPPQTVPAAGVGVRPAPDDPTPTGIGYLCEGRKQVSVVYARNRASVTVDGKTLRLEFQPAVEGFRYFDTTHEWLGNDGLVALREVGTRRAVALNCRPVSRTS